MKKAVENKQYKLKGNVAPLCFMLSSHHNKRTSLLYFDEDKGTNRPLRYAKNQNSPFEDEQDGNAILEPVVFEDGFLNVEKSNQVLQEFLHYHPGNGMIFEEIDHKKDAAEQNEIDDLVLDAQILARGLDLEKLETVARVLLGAGVDRLSTQEIKRDVKVFAKNNPEEFINVLNDPALQMYDDVVQFFGTHLLTLRNKGRDVYFNLAKNKTKILTVPFGEDPKDIMSSHFQTDEGIETYKMLNGLMKKSK